jgi:hypothetical protein
MDNNYLIILIVCVLIFLFVIKNKNKPTEGFVGHKRYGGYTYTDPVYYPLDYYYGKTNTKYDSHSIYSAHPRKLVCIDDFIDKMQHMRLNKAGGIMYTSFNKPSESDKCKKVKCPPQYNSTTPHRLSHYNPYPERRDNLTCWSC